MRKKAISKLNEKLTTLRGKPVSVHERILAANEKEISQLERMIEEIENIKKGAFTPFLQQPPVMAVLALLSGGTSLPLLEKLF